MKNDGVWHGFYCKICARWADHPHLMYNRHLSRAGNWRAYMPEETDKASEFHNATPEVPEALAKELATTHMASGKYHLSNETSRRDAAQSSSSSELHLIPPFRKSAIEQWQDVSCFNRDGTRVRIKNISGHNGSLNGAHGTVAASSKYEVSSKRIRVKLDDGEEILIKPHYLEATQDEHEDPSTVASKRKV